MVEKELSHDNLLKFTLCPFEIFEGKWGRGVKFEILTLIIFPYSGKTALNLENERQG